jgi:hypothetical protein
MVYLKVKRKVQSGNTGMGKRNQVPYLLRPVGSACGQQALLERGWAIVAGFHYLAIDSQRAPFRQIGGLTARKGFARQPAG